MLDSINNWILGIVSAAVIVSIILSIVPKNSVSKIVQMIGGIIIILAIIAPIKGVKLDDFTINSLKYDKEFSGLKRNFDEENEKIKISIIEEKLSSYILDKAGGKIRAKVYVSKNDQGGYYPRKVEIYYKSLSEKEKRVLSDYIKEELGVKGINQHFVKEN